MLPYDIRLFQPLLVGPNCGQAFSWSVGSFLSLVEDLNHMYHLWCPVCTLTAMNLKFSYGSKIISLNQVVLSFSEQFFGILKADFTIPAVMDLEDMKDQFLSEVRFLPTFNFDQMI